ncbi:MAG TPA: hypothetical protein VG839_00665 [Asticcacaulis sp.]|nr:hypothetical protein [Asticcacaulis sp.]
MVKGLSGLMVVTGMALSFPIGTLAALPECSLEQTAGLPEASEASFGSVGYEPKDIDRSFAELVASENKRDNQLDGVVTGLKIDYPFGSMERYGFRLKFVVGADGRVDCASLMPFKDGEPRPEWTPQRHKWAEFVPMWRFMPYLSDGKAVPVMAEFRVMEYELPKAHVPMPSGDPSQVVIIQDMPYFGYHVELHGNGDVVYWSIQPGDKKVLQARHIDPKFVAYILKEAEDADFWSLRDVYPKNSKKPGDYASRIEIRLGGVTKSVTDYDDQESGMPEAGHFLAWGIRHDVPFEIRPIK